MANYADTNAAKLVAAHIIGKSIITAPLEMGEDIADIGGPAHDSASFGSRLMELAATGHDGKGAKLINNWDTNVFNNTLADKTLFCVPETMYEIFDTIFYSVSRDKLVKKSYAELIASDNNDDSYLNLIPVGIIIIPTSLDVYGDGSALMASIRPLDPLYSARYHWTGEYWDSTNNQFVTDSDWINDVTHIYDHNPQHSQSIGALSYGMYWANYSNVYSWRFDRVDPTGIIDNFDNSYKVIPACGASAYTSWITTSPDNRCNNMTTGHVYTGYDQYDNIPYIAQLPIIRSASIDSVSGGLCTYATNTGLIKEKVASPIATDTNGKRSLNPNFFTPVSWTANNNTWKNALTDFDGYANTQKLQKLNEGYDWKTIAEHQLGNSQLNLPDPISAKIWEFYTPGTNRGDWYIPSLGEMAFATIFLSKLYEIPQGNVLTKLINIYSTLDVTYSPTNSKLHKTNVLHCTNSAGSFAVGTNYWLTSTVNILNTAWDDNWTNAFNPGYWLTNSYHGGIIQPFWNNGNEPSVLPVMRVR